MREESNVYRPENNSLGSGQVLHQPYTAEKARLVLREMADQLSLDLVSKRLMTNQIVVTIGYDRANLATQEQKNQYRGAITKDHYGRDVPVHAHGTQNLERYTSSSKEIVKATGELFDRIADKKLLVRRLNVVAAHVIPEDKVPQAEDAVEQLDLFTDYAAKQAEQEKKDAELARERKRQEAMLAIKRKFGKNAILKGMNLEEGATARDRNEQIGGHKA